MLKSKDPRILSTTLQALSRWPEESMKELKENLVQIYSMQDPKIRSLAVKCSHILDRESGYEFIANALEDRHPAVRDDAINKFKDDDPRKLFISWIKDQNIGSPRTQSSILAKLQETGAPNNVMEEVALSKAQDARSISEVLKLLRSHPDTVNIGAMELMIFALQERQEQFIDLTLQAMKSIEDPVTIKIIQAGIKSRDKRISSQAQEALRNLDNQRLAYLLTDIMDSFTNKNTTKQTNVEIANDVRSALHWCSNRNDSWLKFCAAEALATYNYNDD